MSLCLLADGSVFFYSLHKKYFILHPRICFSSLPDSFVFHRSYGFLSTTIYLWLISLTSSKELSILLAIKGKADPLMGLKENVIIGKLIPAGTGLPEVESALEARDRAEHPERFMMDVMAE